MRKQLTLLTCLAIALVTTAFAAEFTVEVRIGSAEAEPTLVFGQAATALQQPFPPFSGMFGVKDVYLANQANFGTKGTVSGDLVRLGTDMRTDVAGNQWVIVAGSDATLLFSGMPENETLYVVDDADSTAASVELGERLAVKAGRNYTISLDATTPAVTPAADPANATVYLAQDDTTKEYLGTSASYAISGTAVTLSIVTGDAPVVLKAADTYYTKNGSSSAERPSAGWILEVANSTSAAVSSATFANAEATITFSADPGTVTLSATALKGSYKPIATTLAGADGVAIAAVNWVIRRKGTLDYDGDGEITANDAYCLRNFVDWRVFDEPEEYNWRILRQYTYDATEEQLQTAFETLVGLYPDGLDFDGDGEITANDAYYLRNFVDWRVFDEPEEYNWRILRQYTYEATEEQLQTAFETLCNLAL